MWIKKVATSLYVSFFIKIIVSALVSLLLFVLLATLSQTYIEFKNTQNQDRLRLESDAIAGDILEQIDRENMTYSQADGMSFDKLPTYQVMFIEKQNLTQSVIDGLSQESVFVYDVEFSDTLGKMYINVYGLEIKGDIYYIISAVISVISFLVLLINFIAKEIFYIKEIESGIKLIATEDILYKIPIKGENELANLAVSINSMGDSIYSSRQKERQDEINQRLLITNMSHDLKTPLTSMIGYIDVIKGKLSKDDELYAYANIAKENGNRLEKLISDLFLYSKLISGDMALTLQTIDIGLMLKQIFEIRTENIVYNEYSGELNASIDAENFHRVIDNLLSNAKKYGIDSEPIEVIAISDSDDIVITIKNQTEDNLDGKIELLQNRLYTASENRTNGSSGLGLSIVTELLKMMNGTLEICYDNKIFTATVKLKKI